PDRSGRREDVSWFYVPHSNCKTISGFSLDYQHYLLRAHAEEQFGPSYVPGSTANTIPAWTGLIPLGTRCGNTLTTTIWSMMPHAFLFHELTGISARRSRSLGSAA